MNTTEMQDIYSDYLLSSMSYTTATGLARMVNGAMSQDQVSRFLAGELQTSAKWWQRVKPLVRTIESDCGVLLFDDSIEEKPHTDENAIVCWHFDHSKDRNIKGINFLSALSCTDAVSIPVAVQLIAKTELGREFVMAPKSNRKVALSAALSAAGRFQPINTLTPPDGTVCERYREGVAFPMLFAKPIFTNEDGSPGILYLVTSDLTLNYLTLTTIYQKRWKVEEYHRSLKQNAALAKSPTKTVLTQTNHFFAALYAYVKLEMLKVSTNLNHYAIKARLYLTALQQAFLELQQLRPISLLASSSA